MSYLLISSEIRLVKEEEEEEGKEEEDAVVVVWWRVVLIFPKRLRDHFSGRSHLIEGRSSETVMLQLMETHCLPIPTYAIDTISVADRDERRRLRVAYNSIYRKIFEYRTLESITVLQHGRN